MITSKCPLYNARTPLLHWVIHLINDYWKLGYDHYSPKRTWLQSLIDFFSHEFSIVVETDRGSIWPFQSVKGHRASGLTKGNRNALGTQESFLLSGSRPAIGRLLAPRYLAHRDVRLGGGGRARGLEPLGSSSCLAQLTFLMSPTLQTVQKQNQMSLPNQTFKKTLQAVRKKKPKKQPFPLMQGIERWFGLKDRVFPEHCDNNLNVR